MQDFSILFCVGEMVMKFYQYAKVNFSLICIVFKYKLFKSWGNIEVHLFSLSVQADSNWFFGFQTH